MALTPRTKLGPYELLGAIGAGGMGEVYRARDPRLNREIAIKILPVSFSDDREHLRRFEQEALAAAALNHPNILSVYDIGTQDGAPYIVSELLEGETLRERLRSGPLSLRKTIEYAVQIARGLSAAQDKGIVHRDLKPENIFITRDGRVKLLDFGLAKLTQPSPLMDGSAARTVQSVAGTVLGTVGYMSPEQVRGKPADARSDLFSFGAVLYEMISGRRAFLGESAADTISAILHNEPTELSEVNRSVTPALDRIVRHCLEKNPEERFRSAYDLAFDLEELTTVSSTEIATQAAGTATRNSTRVAVVVIAVLLGLAAVWAVSKIAARPTEPARFHQISYERGFVVLARFAADGHSVIYDAAWDGRKARLFSTSASIPEPRALDLKDAHLFAVSPLGEAALGLGGQLSNHQIVTGATLARAPLGGSAPRELLHDVLAADWAPNGTLAAVHYVSGRMRLEYPVGKVLYETGGWISDLRVSPSGDSVAFLDHPYWPDDRGWVAVVDVAGNKKILSGEWEAEDGLAWAPNGKEIWFTASSAGVNRSVYGVTLAGKQRQVLSVPGSLHLYDIYSDGRVLLSVGQERVGMVGINRAEEKGHDLSWSGWTVALDISPDGKQVLFDEQSEFGGSNYTVATRTMEASSPVKLGDGNGGNYSPDGKWVTSVIPSQPNHFFLLPTGVGEAKDVPVVGLDHLLEVLFTPDGNLAIIGSENGHGIRCYSRSIDGGPLKALTREGSRLCRWSPDSRSIVAADSGGSIYVYPLNGGSAHSLPASDGMFPISWVDNHLILAFRTGEIPGHVFEINVVSGKQRLIKELAPGDTAGVSHLLRIAASPDSQIFAYSYQQALSELYVVEGLK